MEALTQPLREEHKELMPHIELLREVADQIGTIPINSLIQRVSDAYMFLEHHLIPHAQAEDEALYPAVGRFMNAPTATATMSRDHTQIGRLTGELATLMKHISGTSVGASQENDLRRVLYGLYVIVKLHLAKEEEIYLPLLDARFTPEEAQHLFEAMESAASEAKKQTQFMMSVRW